MDYYQTLGVAKNATPDEIKKAYRKLASQHHPDRGGDTAMFQSIQAAYDTLSDPQKRVNYDNPPPQFNGFHQQGGFPFNFGQHDINDIFGQFFRQPQRPQQRIYTVTIFVTLEQIAKGDQTTVQIQSPQGQKIIKIDIPKGIDDGAVVRYDGIMPDGLLQVNFRQHRHAFFERRALDIYYTADISVFDLVIGSKIIVPTIMGKELEITIDARTRPNSTLRLNGHGLIGQHGVGDQYVVLKPTMPDTIDDEIIRVLEKYRNVNTT
jgi:curved DNA-binding protein